MNYTDEQIIKAKGMITKLHEFHLCCRTIFGSHNYDFSEFDFDCLHNVIDEANRLKAENERLNSLCTSKDVIISDLNAKNESLNREIKSLESIQEISPEAKHFIDTKADKVISLLTEVIKSQEQIESEARKKFAERLKMKAWFDGDYDGYLIDKIDIDNLLEEMEK